VNSKGFEIEGKASITNRLDVIASYETPRLPKMAL
jgi:hypothetical protein